MSGIWVTPAVIAGLTTTVPSQPGKNVGYVEWTLSAESVADRLVLG